jgi:transcriptional regulator with XRE-family HTH domain
MAKSKTKPGSPVAAELGERLRRLRESRGLSVRGLAKLASITAGTLSKIENRQTSPSVGTLKDILDGLGTTLGEFFASADGASDGGERFVFRPADLVNLSSENGVSLLGVPQADKSSVLQAFHETYAPGADTGERPLCHEGEDAGFCLSGTMELTVDGRRQILGPGDAFHYRSDRPHRWRNVGQTRAVLVTACTPPTF